jgi:hypothetical protein
MRKSLLIVLILVFGVTEADARRRGHRHRHFTIERFAPPVLPEARASSPERYAVTSRRRYAVTSSRSELARGDAMQMIPPDWQLQPSDPNWKGKRYVAPDGVTSVAFYSAPTEQEPVAAHKKAFAYVDGEELTYLLSEPNWIVVSGLKGDRGFYRKAALACGGATWHHVAFEYPAEAKATIEGLASQIARSLDNYQNDGCDSVPPSP